MEAFLDSLPFISTILHATVDGVMDGFVGVVGRLSVSAFFNAQFVDSSVDSLGRLTLLHLSLILIICDDNNSH